MALDKCKVVTLETSEDKTLIQYSIWHPQLIFLHRACLVLLLEGMKRALRGVKALLAEIAKHLASSLKSSLSF